MYVIGYRYRVPQAARDTYVELQKKVAALYMQAGCRKYLVLKPERDNEQFAEFTFYDSKEAADGVERELTASGALDEPFQEFLRLTGLHERDVFPIHYDVAVLEP